MRAYAEMNDYNLDVIKTKMQAYIGWVVHIQSEDDPNGVDVRIEPKFNLPDVISFCLYLLLLIIRT